MDQINFDRLPQDVHCVIASYLSLVDVGHLQACNHASKTSWESNPIFASLYLAQLGTDATHRLAGHGFHYPPNFSWKEQFQSRAKAFASIRSFSFGREQQYVHSVNVSSEYNDFEYKLEPGEYITSVDIRQGDILDYIQFNTNFYRTWRGGGEGGDAHRLAGGLCLVKCSAPYVNYYGHHTCGFFQTEWYIDPVLDMLIPTRPTSIEVHYQTNISFLSITFNDGTVSTAGTRLTSEEHQHKYELEAEDRITKIEIKNPHEGGNLEVWTTLNSISFTITQNNDNVKVLQYGIDEGFTEVLEGHSLCGIQIRGGHNSMVGRIIPSWVGGLVKTTEDKPARQPVLEDPPRRVHQHKRRGQFLLD